MTDLPAFSAPSSPLFPRLRTSLADYLDTFQARRAAGETPFRTALANNSNAMLGAGTALLNGGRNAWSNAFQGFAQGSQMDQQRRQQAEDDRRRSEAEAAIASALGGAPQPFQDLAAAGVYDPGLGWLQDQYAAPADRPYTEDVNGVKRYIDTGEPVFPGVEAQPDGPDPTAEGALRDDYLKVDQDYRDVASQYQNISNLWQDDTGTSDIALVNSFQRMVDPGVAVREGEYAVIAGAAGIQQQVQLWFAQINNGVQLTPSQREQIKDTADRLYAASLRGHETVVDFFTQTALAYEFDPARIIVPWTMPQNGELPVVPSAENPFGIPATPPAARSWGL